MATKTKPKGRAPKAPASHGSWSAKNLPKKPGDIRYTDAMKKQLMSEVKKADKAGVPRKHVFEKLAKEWSTRSNKFTEHQVSSQFHVLKQRFGYDVARVQQRRIVKPAVSGSLGSTLDTLRAAADAKLELLTAEADAQRVKLRAAKAQVRAGERAVVRAHDKLEAAKAAMAEVKAEQRKLDRLAAQL